MTGTNKGECRYLLETDWFVMACKPCGYQKKKFNRPILNPDQIAGQMPVRLHPLLISYLFKKIISNVDSKSAQSIKNRTIKVLLVLISMSACPPGGHCYSWLARLCIYPLKYWTRCHYNISVNSKLLQLLPQSYVHSIINNNCVMLSQF